MEDQPIYNVNIKIDDTLSKSIRVEDLRYIVFVLDSKIEQHDGKVFLYLHDIKKFLTECLEQKWGSKIIIGSFSEAYGYSRNIEFIETLGLPASVKKIEELKIFNLKS
jgi:hypothetical protein